MISLQFKGLKRLLQYHNWKTILWCSAFFMVQLSHPYMTTGKTIGLTLQTVSKVMSLLFNTQSRFVIAFLLRSKYLLISWLSPPSAVFLQPRKIKSATASTFPPSTCHEVMGLDDMILVLMLSFKPAFSQLLINIHMLFFWIFCFVKFVISYDFSCSKETLSGLCFYNFVSFL